MKKMKAKTKRMGILVVVCRGEV